PGPRCNLFRFGSLAQPSKFLLQPVGLRDIDHGKTRREFGTIESFNASNCCRRRPYWSGAFVTSTRIGLSGTRVHLPPVPPPRPNLIKERLLDLTCLNLRSWHALV